MGVERHLTGPQIAGVAVPRADVDAIVALVAGVEHSQQNALPDAFMDAFRRDAIWTTAHGKRLTGFEEISAFTREVLPGSIEQPVTASYEAVNSVAALRAALVAPLDHRCAAFERHARDVDRTAAAAGAGIDDHVEA